MQCILFPFYGSYTKTIYKYDKQDVEIKLDDFLIYEALA